ncbi:MAG TPA: hypothetical protein VMW48_09165 [Vicinamibacterales bacterium]|nr:hypothetical protein [Vicinamibacterales bacterium]
MSARQTGVLAMAGVLPATVLFWVLRRVALGMVDAPFELTSPGGMLLLTLSTYAFIGTLGLVTPLLVLTACAAARVRRLPAARR